MSKELFKGLLYSAFIIASLIIFVMKLCPKNGSKVSLDLGFMAMIFPDFYIDSC